MRGLGKGQRWGVTLRGEEGDHHTTGQNWARQEIQANVGDQVKYEIKEKQEQEQEQEMKGTNEGRGSFHLYYDMALPGCTVAGHSPGQTSTRAEGRNRQRCSSPRLSLA